MFVSLVFTHESCFGEFARVCKVNVCHVNSNSTDIMMNEVPC